MRTEDFEDRVYQQYYNDVGKYRTLTPEEERTLFKRYRTCTSCSAEIPMKVVRTNCPDCGIILNITPTKVYENCKACACRFTAYEVPLYCLVCGAPRNLDARHTLIISNLRFVVKKAKEFSGDVNRIKTLISAGNAGLVLAVDKYDPKFNTTFMTYAGWWIVKEMRDAINSSGLVHIPIVKHNALVKAAHTGKYVCTHCGYRVDSLEYVGGPSCTEEAHVFINSTAYKHNVLVGGSVELDAAKASEEGTPEEITLDRSDYAAFRAAVVRAKLTPREQYILYGYYNLPMADRQDEPKSLKQLSSVVGVSSERIRQIKTEALEKFKRQLRIKSKKVGVLG
jgi:RNA polymerase nonessential primary-like sigma factor